jgi:hypothetical protein
VRLPVITAVETAFGKAKRSRASLRTLLFDRDGHHIPRSR